MIFRDEMGNEIKEGTIIHLSITTPIYGIVKKLNTGLGIDGTPESQPSIIVEVGVSVAVVAGLNGLVPNIAVATSPKKISE